MSKADTVAFEYAKENGTVGLDYNQIYDAVKHGYHQAEKDMELTWEDVKLIWNITDEMENMPEEEFYQEALKRYKDFKERKKK